MQNELFTFFADEHDRLKAQAKRDGKLDDGVVDVQGTVTLLDPPSTLALDRVSSAACKLYSLTVDQGLAWEAAQEVVAQHTYPNEYAMQPGDRVLVKGWAGATKRDRSHAKARLYEAVVWCTGEPRPGMVKVLYGKADGGRMQSVGQKELTLVPKVRFFRYHDQRPFGAKKMHPVMLGVLHVAPTDPSSYQNPLYRTYRPGTGCNSAPKRLDDITRRYQRPGGSWVEGTYEEISAAEAGPSWTEQYTALLANCMHGPGAKCGGFPACTVGSRCRDFAMLAGAILPAWGAIKPVFQRLRAASDSGADNSVKVPLARVMYRDAAGVMQRLVGVKLDNRRLQDDVCLAIKNFHTSH